jgi:hypothetical protein
MERITVDASAPLPAGKWAVGDIYRFVDRDMTGVVCAVGDRRCVNGRWVVDLGVQVSAYPGMLLKK